MISAFTKVLAAVFLFGCSPAAAPVATSAHDPSNPSAPEGTTPAAASAPAPAAPPASAAHEHDHHHDAQKDGHESAAAAYVCPMHPEVTSDSPGVCPKCNMKLVPKK